MALSSGQIAPTSKRGDPGRDLLAEGEASTSGPPSNSWRPGSSRGRDSRTRPRTALNAGGGGDSSAGSARAAGRPRTGRNPPRGIGSSRTRGASRKWECTCWRIPSWYAVQCQTPGRSPPSARRLLPGFLGQSHDWWRPWTMTPRSLLAPARLAGQSALRTQTDERLVDIASTGSEPAFEAIVALHTGGRSPPTCAAALARAGRGRPSADLRQRTRGDRARRASAEPSCLALPDRPQHRREPDPRHRPPGRAARRAPRPAPTFPTVADRRQTLIEVIGAVQSLPLRQRDAIVLRELEGQATRRSPPSRVSRTAPCELSSTARAPPSARA